MEASSNVVRSGHIEASGTPVKDVYQIYGKQRCK